MNVTLDNHDGVALLRWERPPLNVFDTRLQGDLDQVLRKVSASPEISAVVLTGGANFSAGGDLKEMAGLAPDAIARYTHNISLLTSAVGTLPMPVIAAVRGYALGGGCELALAADFRVCADTARFGLPEAALGVLPGAGGTQRLPRLVGAARAKDLIFSGREADASEAVGIGLADLTAPDREAESVALDWGRHLATRPAPALRAAKRAVDQGLDGTLDDGLGLETELFGELLTHHRHTAAFKKIGSHRE